MIPFSLLQLDVVPLEALDQPFSATSVGIPPWVFPLAFGLLGIIALFGFVLFVVRMMAQKRGSSRVSFDLSVLSIRVPKAVRKEDVEQGKSTQQVQELISVMETVFATVGAIPSEKGFGRWLMGRKNLFSFELVSHQGKISFYIAVPSKFRHFVEEQIHAQFPHAQVEDVPDYNVFRPDGVVMASYLKFKRHSAFPIKTYRKLESDPLNAITNALSKIEDTDGGALQIVVASAPSSWRSEGLRIAKAMQQGKRLKDVESNGMWKAVGKELKNMTTAPKAEGDKKEPYRLSPLEEEMVKGLEEKASKAGLEANIRIVVSSKEPEKAKRYLNDIVGAFGQYNVYEYGNSLQKAVPHFPGGLVRHFIFRHFDDHYRIVLNAEELSSIFHFPLPSTETPKIDWLLARKALPPSNLPTEGVMLGLAQYRGHQYEVRMKQADRRRHLYVIGKSGSGKTALQASMVRQDIIEGRGVCVIDPHGDFAEECLTYVPKHRADDVVFFDPADFERPIGLNMLEFDPKFPQLRTFVINEMLKIFDKLYDLKATGGPMFETYMRNAILLLMDHVESGNTLMDIPRVLADDEYRKFKLSKCKSQEVKDFWEKEAQKAGGEASLANMVPYITSKLASFIYNDYMRPIVGQQKSAFDFYEAMNQQKIILVKLSKGKIGDLNAYLLGMIFVGKILDAALKRGDIPEAQRKDFYLYIDEFQNFLTDSISVILSEARKYGLNLIIAHQFIGQLTGSGGDTKIRDAIFGNVGSMAAFRIGVEDAEFLAKEFAPVFNEYDLVNVESLTCNAKILIDNTGSKPFNFKIQFAPRADEKGKELAKMILELSRYKYGRKRELVEAEMQERRMSNFGDDLGGGLDALDDNLF